MINLKSKISFLLLSLLFSILILRTNCDSLQYDLKQWQFQFNGETIWRPATVPSTLTDNLIDNGMISKNPYFRDNFLNLYSYETKDVTYKTTFEIPSKFLSKAVKNILDFKGLDTHCDVFLNGKKILTSRNMYVGHRVQTEFAAKNQLIIKFNSSANYDVLMAKKFKEQQGFSLPQNFSFTRKPAYQYGWDWGPRVLTVGIWKPVLVECYTGIGQITGVYFDHSPVPLSDQDDIALNVTVDLESNGNQNFYVNMTVQKQGSNKLLISSVKKAEQPYNTQHMVGTLQAPAQDLIWWTWDLGTPVLLRINITVYDPVKNDSVKYSFLTGIRDIKVNQVKDDLGESFTVNLNGKDVFVLGGNYIPPQMSMARVPKQTYDRIIKDAVFARYNMIRVWGGGQFQDDYFYELCDRNGIMIWHDLMYACALYCPSYLKDAQIEQQIFQNVRRIDTHPSLAIWNGNNEVWIGWQHWGWQRNLTDEQKQFAVNQYNKLFKEIIPQNINKVGSKNFYWETSPSTSADDPRTMNVGDVHSWRVWAMGASIEEYEQYIGRFNSEYGMQSLPDMSTIQRFSYVQDQQRNNIIMRLHQRHPKGDEYLPMYTTQNVGTTQKFDRYVYFSQIMQQYALQKAISSLRGSRPYCMGSLYWQLNDVWPCSTWATVDYYGNYKASHYAVRRMHSRLFAYVAHNVTSDDYLIFGVNDTPENISTTIRVRLVHFNGTELYFEQFDRFITGLSQIALKSIDFPTNVKNQSFIQLKIVDGLKQQIRFEYFFAKPVDRQLIDPNLQSKHVVSADGNYLQLTTKNLASYVWISRQVNNRYESWNLEDNYFNLLPGQTRRVFTGNVSPNEIRVTCYEIEKKLAQLQKKQDLNLQME